MEGWRELGSIVSGGQSGVDRAALDFALAGGRPYTGWCPCDGWAEDLPTPPGLLALYPNLKQTPLRAVEQRTVWNVRDSDATLVLTQGDVSSPGVELAVRSAEDLGRPVAVVDALIEDAVAVIGRLLSVLAPTAALNVSGPRESEAPGIYARTLHLLDPSLGEHRARGAGESR